MPKRQVKALEGPGSPVRRDRNKSVNSEACAEIGDQTDQDMRGLGELSGSHRKKNRTAERAPPF